MSRILKGGGGGGGGKKQSAPTQTPDNLRSKDTVEAIFAVCEGPIAGLELGNKSFFIGGTQLQNDSGEDNFDGFTLTMFPGDPEGVAQVVTPALGGSGNSTTVNVPLFSGTKVTRTCTTQPDPVTGIIPVDFLDVRLVVGRLLRSGSDGVFENSLTVNIEYKAESASTWNQFYPSPITISGKTTSSYVKEYRKGVPRISEPYQLRVTKISPENTTELFSDVTWDSFQEINSSGKAYPNTAVLQLVGVATDQFSSIPQFSGIYKGKLIKVPNNYNPETGQYTGIWDGTFKVAYSNNPVWVLYDLVMNDTYGMNAYYPITLDKGDAYEAAQWCDGIVADGSRRYTFNAYITESRPGPELIKYIAGSFNSVLADDRNGKAYLKVDKNDPAVAMFTLENVIAPGFEYSYTDVNARYNDLTVSFSNKDLNYDEDRRRVFNQESIDKYGRIPLDFIAVGCTNAGEAVRRAHYKMLTSLTETEMVSFKTNRLGRYIQPFDVILISDPDMGYGLSGRVKARINPTTISLRDPVWLEAGITYKVVFQTANGVQERQLVPSVGRLASLTFTQNLPEDVVSYTVFSITQDGAGYGLPKPYRVLKVEENDGGTDSYGISAIELNRLKFSDADNLTFTDEINYSFTDVNDVAKPTGLAVTEEISPAPDRPRVNLILRWDKATSGMVRRYRVELRRSAQETYRLYSELADTEVVITDVQDGTYDFRVSSVSIKNFYSKPAEVSHKVAYQFYDDKLPSVTGLELEAQGNNQEFTGRNARFTWRVNYPQGYFELGKEPKGADTTYKDQYFKEFSVSIYDADTGALVYTDTSQTPSYVFSYESNVKAFGSAHRRLRIAVSYRNTLNKVSTPASITVTNPAPIAPVNLQVVQGVGYAAVRFTEPTDQDYVGTIIWRGSSPNLQMIEANKIFQGAGNNIVLTTDPNSTFYIRVAHYDAFGMDGLNPSPAMLLESAYKVDTTPPDRVTGLTLTTGMGADETPFIIAEWDASQAGDFASYQAEIRRKDDAPTAWVPSLVTEAHFTWKVSPNTIYLVRVRATDNSANSSEYSDVSEINSDRDVVPPGIVTNQTVDAGFRTIVLSWTNPTDGDFSFVEVWESDDTNLANAVKVDGVFGNTFNRGGLEPGVTKHYWLRAVDTSSNKSAFVGPLTTTTASLQLPDFPADFGPIPLVSILPPGGPTTGVQYAFLTSDQRLYKWDGAHSQWKSAFNFAEIEGAITSTQITPGSISTPHLSAGSITTALLAAGAVTADNIAANSITAGKLQAGAVTADKIAAGTVITNRAQIADAIIDTAHISEIDASKIKAGSVLAGSITVEGQTLSAIKGGIGDPAGAINSGSTKIDPGRVSISGGTTLRDWRNGDNSTEINGGAIGANTVSANKLNIGARGITVQGVEFKANKVTNTASWTGGDIFWIDDSGNKQATSISGNTSVGVGHIFWVKGNNGLSWSSNWVDAVGNDRVHLAAYHGGSLIIANYGGTIIDGERIVTGSILAGQIAANAIQANHIGAAQIAANHLRSDQVVIVNPNQLGLDVVGSAQIQDLAVDTLRIAGNAVTIPLAQTDVNEVTGNGSSQIVTWVNYTLDYPGHVTILFSGLHSYSTQDIAHTIWIKIDGSQVIGRGGLQTNDYPTILYSTYLNAGAHYIEIEWYAANSNLKMRNRTITVLGAKK